MADKRMSFSEILADVGHGPLDDETEEAPNTLDEPEADAESPPAPDNSDEDSSATDDESSSGESEKDELESAGEESEAPDDDGEKEGEDAPSPEAEAADDENTEPTVEIDGEQVPLSQIREWKLNGLRHEDYTRKRQQDSEARKSAEQQAANLRKLAREIAEDDSLQDFLKVHPDAIGILMEEPEATRQLLGNAKRVEDFWEDYEVIKQNPRLADRLAKQDGDEEELSDEVRQQRYQQSLVQVGAGLDGVVDALGKQYFPDVDTAPVSEYILELAGIDAQKVQDKTLTFEEYEQGMQRLYRLFYVPTADGPKISTKLIVDRFEMEKKRQHAEAESEDGKAAAHNNKVDQALAASQDKDGRIPKGPKGSAPRASEPKVEPYDDFRQALDDIVAG